MCVHGRWDESGNPACLSLDGKTCVKGSVSCGEKLKQLDSVIKSGKIKPLVCGEAHKKVWGFDGYSQSDHWCSLTKRLFTEEGELWGGVGRVRWQSPYSRVCTCTA